MNNEEIKNRIFYSKAMKSLHGKEAPIKGYSDAGAYSREVQRVSNMIATINGLDPDYCSILALTKFLGIPPYGIEGRQAIDNLLGGTFNQSQVSIGELEKITNEPASPKLIKDIEILNSWDLENSKNSENVSNEARCVEYTEEILESIKLMTAEELNKMGGSLFTTSLAYSVTKNSDGELTKGELLEKITNTIMKRRKSVDLERVKKIMETLKTKIIDGVIDEQGIIRDIIENQ